MYVWALYDCYFLISVKKKSQAYITRVGFKPTTFSDSRAMSYQLEQQRMPGGGSLHFCFDILLLFGVFVFLISDIESRR